MKTHEEAFAPLIGDAEHEVVQGPFTITAPDPEDGWFVYCAGVELRGVRYAVVAVGDDDSIRYVYLTEPNAAAVLGATR